MKKILVITSGGDAPGMNAALRAVVRTAHQSGLQVFGTSFGYQGLIDRIIFPLHPENVANCIQLGGTIIKAGRSLEFLEKPHRDKVRAFLEEQAIDGMVVIGGNGSFRGAAILESEGGPKTIGIPATIDNDIPGTEYTLGFDTARNTALWAIDHIRDTAFSHDRHFLVEVMGRHSGFIALDVGIAGGAEFILTPEFPISMEDLAVKIKAPRRPRGNSIIIVAEADEPGRSVHIAEDLKRLTQLSYRVCILGHIQRGGSPTTLDRKMGSLMGYMAVKALCDGQYNEMVAMNQDQLSLRPFPPLAESTRILTEDHLIHMNGILCS